MTTVKVFAPAKINLTLHVTGQRADGFHVLDSLVAFASVGDWLTFEDAATLSLTITGARARELPGGSDNLVTRAAQVLSADLGAAITLEKILPVSSGIGGGSADAAATIRGLARLWDLKDLSHAQQAGIVGLGADVAMCLLSTPCRAEGIGERLTVLPALPKVHVVLVNPGVAVATPDVFKALKTKNNPEMPIEIPAFGSARDLAGFLARCRNDLEEPALSVAPVIADVKSALTAAEGCLFARMSGSGATCFGLFDSAEIARRAASQIKTANPHWWVAGGELLPDAAAAGPQLIRATT